MALRRSAAILEARRSTGEEGEASDKAVGGWTGASTAGMAWRKSVRGPMLEKSLPKEGLIKVGCLNMAAPRKGPNPRGGGGAGEGVG